MRILLLPLSLLYGVGVFLINKLFDLQIKKSVEFELPVISVGNLSTGGTGKTPHVEYLVKLLSEHYHVGVMSRGYRRKTTGYFLVKENSLARDAGDESLQIKRKFPEATVAVCEERALGIPVMLLDDPLLQVIILDDAFQHRRVKPGLSILLTDFSKPFSSDYLLPAGNLREPKQNASRANVIVVTKCPDEISSAQKNQMAIELRQNENQPVFFSSLKYSEAYSLFHPEIKFDLAIFESALLVTGIASPENLLRHVQSTIKNVQHIRFGDHHFFSLLDLKMIKEKFDALPSSNKIILTTEKDAVRLLDHAAFFAAHDLEITCMPVEINFSMGEKEKFDSCIKDFLMKNRMASHD